MRLNVHCSEFRTNPYPTYRKLRKESPVCRTEPYGDWVISRHSDVAAVLRSPQLFLSAVVDTDPGDGPSFLMHARTLIGNDGKDHSRLRTLVSQAFTPNRVNALEPKIRTLCQNLLAKLSKEKFDFISEFAMPLPVTVIAELLGIDSDKKDEFKRWSDTLITWRNTSLIHDLEQRRLREIEIQQEIQAMYDYFTAKIAERQKHPESDLISALVLANETSKKLSSLEVLGFVRLLLVAGNETTTNLLGNIALVLLEKPEVRDQVKADPSLIPQLIEETLRYNSPSLSLSRKASEDTEIAGVKISKGDGILPLLASANHDESIFENPEEFKLDRNFKKMGYGHLSFGGGVHFCLGAPLARLQARVAFEEILKSFQYFERTTKGPLDFLNSFFFRGLTRLELRALRERQIIRDN